MMVPAALPSLFLLPLALAHATRHFQSGHHDAALVLAREESDYINTVCSPNITSASDDAVVIPPCIEVTAIQQACTPNGTTDASYYAAHAECMCGGSYFDDWAGCQACLLYHGGRSERDEAFYRSVVDVASSSLCGFLDATGTAGTTAAAAAATPTTDFAAIFSAVAATLAPPTTGATVSSDQAPSSTAVSLYFTPSESQGPGAITGSAATATGTAATTARDSSASESGSEEAATTTTTRSKTSSSSGGGASSSSSEAGAMPTKAAGGVLLGLVGLAVAAGL